MILPIIQLGNKRLKEKSLPVEDINDEIKKLVDDLFDTMYDAKGIGLAAVQVGVLKRLFICDVPEHMEEPLVAINPEIIKRSRDHITYEEGCLSIPGVNHDVERPNSIILRYQDVDGESYEETFEGLSAVCVQHEYDHLDGVLFLDHLKPGVHKKVNKALESKDLPRYY